MRRILTLAVFGLFAAACGGDDGASAEGGGDQAAVEAPQDAEVAGAPMDEEIPMDDEEVRVVAGGGDLGGWMGRTDAEAPFDNVLVSASANGWQVDNGPAVVLWKEDLAASGDYTLSGTFHQVSSKGHAHGTGLVFGGNDMDGQGQAYTYFMVRGSGDYLVKYRTGEETFWVPPTDGWVPHAAINTDDSEGMYTNTLSVQIVGQEAIFSVNGTEVLKIPRGDLQYSDGFYGVRMNHNLTIHFSDLTVTPGA